MNIVERYNVKYGWDKYYFKACDDAKDDAVFMGIRRTQEYVVAHAWRLRAQVIQEGKHEHRQVV